MDPSVYLEFMGSISFKKKKIKPIKYLEGIVR